MRKAFFTALLFSVGLFPVNGRLARAQTLRPLAHPNHYILLIDASGSMVTSEEKKSVFEKALNQTLLRKLYQEGFGETIPAFVPAEDYLTLHHFGVVTGESSTAFSRLHEYDLLTQFIHTAIIRKKGISSEVLRAQLFPAQFYQYTIMSWAKQLAMLQSEPVSSDDVSNRTFLVMVHDAQPNENSLAAEVEMVYHHARETHDKALFKVNEIDSAYRFTDGNGNNKPAWSERLQGATNAYAVVFVEAYEVISSSQSKWEAGGLQLHPVESLDIRWSKASGTAPQGTLTATLNKSFTDWIKQAQASPISLSVEADGQKISQPSLEVPFTVQGSLSCSPRLFNADLDVSLSQTDKLLGKRNLNYNYTQAIAAPLPFRCTLGFIFSTALIVLLGILLIAALVYYVYYRFYATHLEIQIPGVLMPISLRRRVQIAAPAQLVPQRELEALSLKLPNLLKQCLFYRGATVTLAAGDGPKVYWANRDVDRLDLPSSYEYVSAYWERLPDKPSSVTLNYQQGKQHMGVTLSYPGGAPEEFKGVQK